MTNEPSLLALVTGASSGIGVDFSRELAARGFDLVLTARRTDRLEAVKSDLEGESKVRVHVVAGDLGSPAGARRLYDDVCQLEQPVSFLVNNAGVGKFGHTLDQSLDDIQAMIQLNVLSLTILTRLFAEDFKSRGRSYILNNASYSAIQPPPPYAVYAGTKAFQLAFSQALHHDLHRYGTRVTALCPGFFASEFLERAEHSPSRITKWLMLDTRRVARAGIRGVLRGHAIVIPGVRYKALNLCVRCLPRTAASWLADFAVRF